MVFYKTYCIDIFGFDDSIKIEDIEKMTEFHTNLCKIFIILNYIKVHVIPQFTYLISTALVKSNVSDSTDDITHIIIVESSQGIIKEGKTIYTGSLACPLGPSKGEVFSHAEFQVVKTPNPEHPKLQFVYFYSTPH